MPDLPPEKAPKGSRFWLSFSAVIVCNFLSALDVTAVSTALPTITDELHGGNDFVWVGAAYGLAAAAIMPFTAKLADTLGRRPTMMICVGFFFVGSALSGSAQTMNWLIAARTVQGIGGGGIINLASIILSDLVSLAERGVYQGFLIMTYAIAAAVGPSIGGSLAEKATWRWLFYLNLPLSGIAFTLVTLFLRVKTPPGTLLEKLSKIDWFGAFLAIAGTTLVLVALTWGGIQFPWGSAHVLAPLIIGALLLVIFVLYEKFVAREPILPLDIMANRTSFCGYLGTFFHGIVSISIIYYLPVYFQACMDATPIQSSVKVFATTFIVSPFSIFCGILVKATNKYRPINYVGWALSIIGCGLLSLLKADSRTAQWVGFQIIAAAGIGIVWASTVFPILAPLPVTRAAPALAFYNFSRVFAQTWGVTISASILQNELKKRLPEAFLSQFPQGIEIAYAAIPAIRHLEDPLRAEVRDAFAASLSLVWKAMIGFSAAAFVTTLALREVPMQRQTDDTYGLEGAPLSKTAGSDMESAGVKDAVDLTELPCSDSDTARASRT
ncbi:iron permease [Cubamyces lactineus]|nr:iron permease [Cubamyces lactineus]